MPLGELNELRQILRQVHSEKVAKKRRESLSRVIAYMTIGVDVSSLFSEMVMACSTNDFVEKKMAYLYLTTYAESNPELAILAVNTLQKDASHDDPHIRGLALRSLCSLKLSTMSEYLEKAIFQGLRDRSGYVRRTAVMGCLKLYRIKSPSFLDEDMMNILHDLLDDVDPQVVRNSLIVLNEIHTNKGGLPLTKERLNALLLRIKHFDEWGQCIVLDWISGYHHSNENEMFAIMNILDDFLKHPSSAVTLSCTKCFLSLTEENEGLFLQVVERLKDPFISLMRKSSSEISYAILLHISLLIDKGLEPVALLFENDCREFYCKFSDFSYIKTEKIKILTKIVTNENAQSIYSELFEYVVDANTVISKGSIEALGTIAAQFPSTASTIMENFFFYPEFIFLSFLTIEIEHVVPTILNTLKNLLMNYRELYENILPVALQCIQFVTDPLGLSSIVWMIGEFGEHVEDSPYILEDCIREEDQGETLRLALLTASMKLFFKRPAEMQPILGKLFKNVLQESSYPDARDRALLYYRLLSTDVEKAKEILLSASKERISSFQETRFVDVERIFTEFNTISVILGKSSSHFVVVPHIPFHGRMEMEKNAILGKNSSKDCSFPHSFSLLEGFIGDDKTKEMKSNTFSLELPSSSPSVFSFIHSNPSLFPSNDPSLLLTESASLVSPVAASSSLLSPPPFRLISPEEINASSFQEKWDSVEKKIEIKNKMAAIRREPFKGALTLPIIEEFLSDFNILTMASGTMDSEAGPIMKLFVYAQDDTLIYYFAEIRLYLHLLSMELIIKGELNGQPERFKEALVYYFEPFLDSSLYRGHTAMSPPSFHFDFAKEILSLATCT
ncbi:HEAT repeat-containing protein [Cardiosporidium cionae]|uniref:HEAT repeat-containing protein n=1 Tax=Cardiosporidium cionae TaxID=476202 RepID=A0ABQ7J826_9APIC|nr:HEAT repeat-containing protein [Cardiosporidium cionae]|eukprot:KAF8820147.1 HEAT repeat-containing protein [Cardiosporidium cionae]